MPEIDVRNALVIVIRNEETKPRVVAAFDGEREFELSVQWVATQPRLLEIAMLASRAAGNVDGVLDALNIAAGGETGSDAAWLAAWCELEPAERRRRLAGTVDE